MTTVETFLSILGLIVGVAVFAFFGCLLFEKSVKEDRNIISAVLFAVSLIALIFCAMFAMALIAFILITLFGIEG